MDIDAHRATSHISIDAYVKGRQIELGCSLDGRIPIYLDQNFWIYLRKAEEGLGTEAEKKLLRLLRELTRSGVAFFPISETVFMELMKQDDIRTRLSTAQIIDELSLGVSLIPYDLRAGTELAHFVHSFLVKPSELHPLRHLVWTKLSYVLGFVHPSNTPFDAETELAIQKSFLDEIWSIPLADFMKKIGSMKSPGDGFANWAETTNEEIVKHADELRSFQRAYETELRGAVSSFGDRLMNIERRNAEKQNVQFPPTGSNAWNELRNMWMNALLHALKQESARKVLPSIHVGAALHAAFRWDKTRRFEGNDLYDFFHASAALAFCGAFFTEQALCSTITNNHIRLDKLYNCYVVANVSGAIAYLDAIKSAMVDPPTAR